VSRFYGQGYQSKVDTITYAHRIGGSLDSIDLLNGSNSATFPGGGWNTRSNILTTNFILNSPSGQLFWSLPQFKPFKFSGLPHLGVAYMFGSTAQQYVKAEYEQSFRQNVMLNVDYEKRSSNGILRNSAFDHEQVALSLKKVGLTYSFDLRSAYNSSKISQSGGIVADSLPRDYALGFIPVNRTDSEVKTKRANVGFSQYLDFVKDSTKASGVFMDSEFKLKKFNLNESDTIYGLYPVIHFDSLQTSDQHQHSSISASPGIFYSDRYSSIKLSPSVNYWRFYNLGRFNDTLEIGSNGEIEIHRKKTQLLWKGNVNFVGAQGEWKQGVQLKYISPLIGLSLHSDVQSVLPDYYQRYALGNNASPIGPHWDRQFRQYHEVRITEDLKKIFFELNLNYSNARNNYWFVDSTWRNDTLTDISNFQLGATVAKNFGLLHLQLNYKFTKSIDQLNYIPQNQLFTRVYVKGGIFKARKMIAYAGIEAGYLSTYQALGYLPQVAALSFLPTGRTLPNQTVLHFYSGFQIEDFKFFFRLENLQSFWADKTNQSILGYPVAPFQIKLGITWDFFD